MNPKRSALDREGHFRPTVKRGAVKLERQVPAAIAAGCVVLALLDCFVRMLSVGDDEAYILAAASVGLRCFLALCGLVAVGSTFFVVGNRWPQVLTVLSIVAVSVLIIIVGDALYESAVNPVP